MGAQAAWLTDPTARHELRWWDGAQWTEHVSDAGQAATDALLPDETPPPPPAVPVPPPPPGATVGAAATGAPGGTWKDRLKSAAQQAATQGKALADQAKEKLNEQQAKRAEQWANDPDTLWFGTSQSAAGNATGMSKAFYRVTADRVWMDTGVLGIRSESVPLWAVRDIDVRQNVLQRNKDIGDVVLRLEDPGYSVDPTGSFQWRAEAEPGKTSGEAVLDNIEGPHQVRDLLLPLVSTARSKKLQERQTQYVHVNPATAAATGVVPGAPTAGGATSPADVADQLRKLAELRDEGILSEEEFATQKARLLGG